MYDSSTVRHLSIDKLIQSKWFHILTHLLTHVGTLTKKTGDMPTKSEYTPKRAETEFFYKLGFSN